MQETSDFIVSELAKHDVRLTGARLKIIDYIRSVPHTFTAEDACADLPHIGRATVYRTLKLLLDAGILCKIVLPGDGMAYILSAVNDRRHSTRPHDQHHHHVVCTICGAVRLFTAEAIEKAVEGLDSSAEALMGQVIDHRFEVYDICTRCGSVAEGAMSKSR